MGFLPPLIVGEVLFDHFPAQKRVLGGAPFNVAWNLCGLGLSPIFLSAVGDDSEGREVREKMKKWGLSDRVLQQADAPTGKVRVQVEKGQPSFEILDHQAYDFIQPPDFPVTDAKFSLLYLGSLAFRHPVSRATIQRLIASSGLPRFVDINIRSPWFSRDWLPDLLGGARWIKMNEQELALITGMSCDDPSGLAAASTQVRNMFQREPQCHYITHGSQGAYVVDPEGQMHFAPAPQPQKMVDAVGAGDAFAAATIAGIVRGEKPQSTLEAAVHFASRTCGIQGATTEDHDHYQLPVIS